MLIKLFYKFSQKLFLMIFSKLKFYLVIIIVLKEFIVKLYLNKKSIILKIFYSIG